MLSFFQKYTVLISVLLFLSLLIVVCLFPSSGLILTTLFTLCGFVLASLPVLERHRRAYLQGKISRSVNIRSILFDLVVILLALIVAAVLGRFIAEIATEHISNDLTKLIASIVTGLLIGIAVGSFVQQSWRRFIKVSPEK
jgi:hypothetical protein